MKVLSDLSTPFCQFILELTPFDFFYNFFIMLVMLKIKPSLELQRTAKQLGIDEIKNILKVKYWKGDEETSPIII